MWARGYFCATVGAMDEETIKAYIENQKWDGDDQGFQNHGAHRALSRLLAGGLQAASAALLDFQPQRILPAFSR